MRRHPRLLAAGQHDDLIALPQHAAGDLPGVAAVVVQYASASAVPALVRTQLHREADALTGTARRVAGRSSTRPLEVLEQRRALVPGHAVGAVDDVVAVQRADRDELDVGDLERARRTR